MQTSKIIDILKDKINYIKQLEKELITKTSKVQKLINISEFGNIVLIDKKYHQFVGKRVNGKQKKVYIGKDQKKLNQFLKAIETGKEVDKLIARVNDINDEIQSFSERVNPRYF